MRRWTCQKVTRAETKSKESHPADEIKTKTERSVLAMNHDGGAHKQAGDWPIHDHGVLSHLIAFAGSRMYLFVASVSRSWRDAWGDRAKVTSRSLALQSASCLDWAKGGGLSINDGPCLLAAATGRLDLLRHAVSIGYFRECMPVCEHAAGGGYLNIVKWCRDNGYPWRRTAIRAAEGGHIEVLKWCHQYGCPLNSSVFEEAARGGHVTILRWGWFMSLISRGNLSKVLKSAVEGGNLDAVKWCRSKRSNWSPDTCYEAAKSGNLELLRWCRRHGCPWSTNTMCGAVEAQHSEMLIWCKAKGCPWDPATSRVAARHEDVEILIWCVANGSQRPGDRDVLCRLAAAHGHLDVLKWCRANGYPWGTGACFFAACGGHLEVLKWCVEHGCQWDCGMVAIDKPMDGSDSFKLSLEIMVWAMSNGCPWKSIKPGINRIMYLAVVSGDLEFLKWCCSDSPTFNRDLRWFATTAASAGHLHTLEWIVTQYDLAERWKPYRSSFWARGVRSRPGHGWSARVCQAAVEGGSLEVLQWCRENGFPWSGSECMFAARRGDLEMLAWCRSNGCPLTRSPALEAQKRGDAEMLVWCQKCDVNL